MHNEMAAAENGCVSMVIEFYERVLEGDAVNYQRIGTTKKAENITYQDTYCEYAGFSFEIPRSAQYVEALTNGIFVMIDGTFWGVIEDVNKEYNSTASTLAVSGPDLKSYITDKRIVIPTDYLSIDGTAGYDKANGYTDGVIKHFWRNNISAPPQPGRQIKGVQVASNADVGLADDKYMSRFENVRDITEKLCVNANIGFMATLENDIITLNCYKGIDRTVEQSINPRAILELSRKNISSISYTKAKSNYKNAFYSTRAGDEFADESLTLLYYPDDIAVSGIERREIWNEVQVDALTPGSEYEEMEKQAKKNMSDYEIVESLTCAILPNAGYKTVWDIGDTVTIRLKEENVTVDLPVTAVTTSADSSGIYYTAKFGKSKPHFIGAGQRLIKI